MLPEQKIIELEYECSVLREKVERYEELLREMNRVMKIGGSEDCLDVSIIDTFKKTSEMREIEYDLIKEQDNMHNYNRIHSNVQKMGRVYDMGSGVLKFGRAALAFVL